VTTTAQPVTGEKRLVPNNKCLPHTSRSISSSHSIHLLRDQTPAGKWLVRGAVPPHLFPQKCPALSGTDTTIRRSEIMNQLVVRFVNPGPVMTPHIRTTDDHRAVHSLTAGPPAADMITFHAVVMMIDVVMEEDMTIRTAGTIIGMHRVRHPVTTITIAGQLILTIGMNLIVEMTSNDRRGVRVHMTDRQSDLILFDQRISTVNQLQPLLLQWTRLRKPGPSCS
jgi:hypothetical protein